MPAVARAAFGRRTSQDRRSPSTHELDSCRRPSEHDGAARYQGSPPRPSGNESVPNHANYDESKANPFPNLPDALTLKSGAKVTTSEVWWHQRRPEIVEDFEREMYGRVPANAPRVTWTCTSTENTTIGSHPVISKQLTGHVDNSLFPLISVDIQMTLVTPADSTSPVPLMMLFRGGFPPRPRQAPPGRIAAGGPATGDPPASEQLIAAGWGYASINPASIQADNVNRGHHRARQ